MPSRDPCVQDIDRNVTIARAYLPARPTDRVPASAGEATYDSPLSRGESMIRAVPRLAALLLATVAVPSPSRAAPPAAEAGVKWEQTVEMQMAGFSMPARTSTVCVPSSGLAEPPSAGPEDGKCKVTDVRNDGRTMRWSMTCDGDEKMSGEGEIVQGKDGYDGKMTVRGSHGEMLMKMRGRRLGGACDAGEVKRTVAALQAQGEARTAQACREAAQAVSLPMFGGAAAPCKDPADRKLLCERAATREGVKALSVQPATVTRDLGALCGKDLATLQAGACAAAGREESGAARGGAADDLLAFIGSDCPSETRAIAQRECAGRTYTDLSTRYRSFCTAYAGDLLDKGKKPAPATPKPEDAAQEAAKKAVKGLLPW